MISNGVVYFFSSLFTQSVNLVLIPLYTNNLTQEQYGQFDLIMSVQQLLMLGITLGVFSGMVRFFNEYENRQELRNTALTFSLLWGSICVLIIWLVNPFIYPMLFDSIPGSNLFLPFVIMSSVLVCLNLIYSSYYAMQFQALKSSAVQIATIVTTLLLALYFFLVLDMGIIGILQAQLFSNLAVFIVLFLIHLKSFKLRWKQDQLRKMLSYGTGLMLGDISAWVLSLSDRFLIRGFMNLSSVAVYSIGYKIGMLINPFFINPFTSVFTPFKYKVYNEENGQERIGKMFRLYNFVGWLCVLGLSLFANIGVSLVATEEYRDANYVIPIIALSYFLSGAIAFYSLGLHIANKMRLNSAITVIAALVNILCNMLLIPWMGIYGSALSTVIAYVISNLLFYRFGSKYYPLRLSLWEPYKYLVVFVPIYGIHVVVMQMWPSLLLELLLNGVLCIVFVLVSLFCSFISRDELMNVLQQVILRKVRKLSYKGVQAKS